MAQEREIIKRIEGGEEDINLSEIDPNKVVDGKTVIHVIALYGRSDLFEQVSEKAKY